MNKQQHALELFHIGYNCAQSVLAPFATDYGLDEHVCLKASCAFGGGMARQQFTCGAVTGAIMALGLKFGMGEGDPADKKLETYDKTREFFRIFREKHGSTECLALLDGLRMDDPADKIRIDELDLHRVTCDRLVADAVETAENLMK
jgi:C_GCAxxG_C_C family probable redox protein